MKNINKITVSIIALVIVVFSISSMAGTGHELTLNATKDHPAAKGTALINDNYVSIQARGLKSNSIYTVWKLEPDRHLTCLRRMQMGLASIQLL